MAVRTRLVSKVFVLFILTVLSVALFAREEVSNDSENSLNQQNQQKLNRTFIPGDAVAISTLPDTASFLNGVFPIDDRGYVELPVYGKAKISHMSKDDFVKFLRDNFRNYLRFPDLQVKPMIRLSVLGAVASPGFYYFDPQSSLWEVLHLVGGTLDENGLKDMRWERNGKVVDGNLIPKLQSGISLSHMGFRSGDQIWVKTLGKPGFVDKASKYLSVITATASILTLYITYVRFIENNN